MFSGFHFHYHELIIGVKSKIFKIPKQMKFNYSMKFSFPWTTCFSSASEIVVAHNSNSGGQKFRLFSYKELEIASNGFRSSNKIGEGSSGAVYKGRLQDGTMVAIKVFLVELESLRGEREFISEVTALSNIKHENLVSFQGCCIDKDSRFLVYDYMENNSIAQTLLGDEQNRMKFGWEARRDILLGIARGLAYLHEEVEPHVVHRDIKSSNILLDRDFTPKVADFGLSKLFRNNISHISTHVAGTLGYLAPEYAISGHLTRKSDIYSYGVLLLEIISGQSVVHFDLEHGEHYLVQKAWGLYEASDLLQLLDPTLKPMNFPEEEAVRFLKVGLLCVQETVGLRPKMSVAVKMLTGEIDIENVKITQPGHVDNLMDIKIHQRNNTSKNIFSKTFTSTSTSTSSSTSNQSPHSSTHFSQ